MSRSSGSVGTSSGSSGASSRTEELCIRCAEEIFGVLFPKVKHDQIRNPKTGYKLELDGYNPIMKLAIEYNGEQHYKQVKRFQSQKDDFTQQVYRDYIKAYECHALGIFLITVPSMLTDEADIRAFLEASKEAYYCEVREDKLAVTIDVIEFYLDSKKKTSSKRTTPLDCIVVDTKTVPSLTDGHVVSFAFDCLNQSNKGTQIGEVYESYVQWCRKNNIEYLVLTWKLYEQIKLAGTGEELTSTERAWSLKYDSPKIDYIVPNVVIKVDLT